jgi:lipopolysaccharide transport system ATP-binding protein
MSSIVIKAEGVGKSFVINHEQKERYIALRDVVGQKAKKIFSFPFAVKKSPVVSKEIFWALSDIGFTVEQGDRLGIIGRNGAGKSTLLKILSRITEPTTGAVSIKGRVASLLEVGTGFHPELTGRENIFLNGAILGMSRQEIKMKFDEIVDFAEVEQFLDTPVKRYSSGMYVRLAFAVAAHLEPEILVVDEVLAVGDAQFQKKCLDKMQDVSNNEGRTVLFVSHNTNMLSALCKQGLLLDKGRVLTSGTINQTLDIYLKNNSSLQTFATSNIEYIFDCDYFTLKSFKLTDTKGAALERLIDGRAVSQIVIAMEGIIKKKDERLCFGYDFTNERGEQLFYVMHTDQPFEQWPVLDTGAFNIKMLADIDYINEGGYIINFTAALHGEKMLATAQHGICAGFEKMNNASHSPYWQGKKNTLIAPIAKTIN